MIRSLSRLVLGAAALALVVSVAACDSSDTATKAEPTPSKSEAPLPTASQTTSPASAGAGTVSGKTAQNDTFHWAASKVDYAATVPGNDNTTKKPDDGKRFCLITTTVKNLSSTDQTVAGLDYNVVAGSDDDISADGFLTGDPGFPFATQTSLASGAERTMQFVFQVPTGVKATDLVVGGDFTKPGTGLKIPLG